ncbi:MAG: preprotein translocase subunit YajC [Lachnospiraceae bacterium]|nr:preprotein translocase subunit YajC [Lachnospiraceae bacterium]
MGILLTADAAAAAPSTAGSGLVLVSYIVVLIAVFYFFISRPQKKEQKRLNAMYSSMAVGDSVLTNSGFYGMIIDIDEEQNMVIVEFGNNKNCRIPMDRSAIAQVEKPDAE